MGRCHELGLLDEGSEIIIRMNEMPANSLFKMVNCGNVNIEDGISKLLITNINNTTSIHDFEKKNINQIHDYDFSPGELILVLNKKIKPDVGCKCKPRYFSPMVVVKCLQSSAYILTEVNGAISHLKFAAFCLIPYHS
ncbi:hypothetical protein AN958_11979 [Leucoagaricus sp. SymC.cos]|nr:hypothetical protein AN958_11979 [Leucoagaricus sp. SymC.cos]